MIVAGSRWPLIFVRANARLCQTPKAIYTKKCFISMQGYNHVARIPFRNKTVSCGPSPWGKGISNMFTEDFMLARTFCVSRTYVTSVQKKKAPLSSSTSRPTRKKTADIVHEDNWRGVVAYSASEELLLEKLKKAIVDQGLYIICDLPIDVVDAIHVRAKYKVDEELREVFFFREGTAVFWNVPEVERREVLKFLQRHCDGRYDLNLVLHESEHMSFQYTDTKTNLVEDTIHISSTEDPGQQVLEKYTFSNAMSQSVKLGMLEAILAQFVASIEPVTEDLRDGRKIKMSRRDVLRKTGELFALRHLINLSSDLLDTPDFYWERNALEPLYQKACSHLNTFRRTRVMNERLNHCCELTELLSSHLNDVHHTRLEWMIIILILVEVVFEIIHYIERYLSAREAEAIDTKEASS